MVDIDYHIPFTMSEILTLDNHGNIKANDLTQTNGLEILQKLSIGRLYRYDECCGTGFIVSISERGPLFLTCKHLAIDMFTNEEIQCCVCFDFAQSNYSIDSEEHFCGVFFKLELLGFASNYFDPTNSELDPITNCQYNLPFDAALFLVKNECICNNYFQLLPLVPAKLSLNPPNNEEIYTIGYMGNITMFTAPLTKISDKDIKKLNKSLIQGNITISRGNILEVGDLCCVSNPTTSGFSGSPVLYKQNDELKVWGIFLGGPALKDHEFLVQLALKLARNKAEAIDFLGSFDKSEYKCINYLKSDLQNSLTVNCVKRIYKKLINVSRKNNFFTVEKLNHNLCISLKRISGFLAYHNILIERIE